MRFCRIKNILIVGVMSLGCALNAYAPITLLTPYDTGLRPEPFAFGRNYKFDVRFEKGIATQARNGEDEKVSLLALNNPYESAVYMLYGFPAESEQTAVLESLTIDSDKTGLISGNAELKAFDAVMSVMRRIPLENLPGTLYGQVMVPFRHLSVESAGWKDVTEVASLGASSVKTKITNDLANNVQRWGGLNIDSWDQTGIGDISFNLGWYSNFKQTKEHLRNVHVHFRMGYSLPSGQPKDEDIALSLPLGNDGAGAVPVRGALRLDFIHHIKVGLNIDILSFFDETRIRRLKTHELQTDYFLLSKGMATKTTGSMWRFCTYVAKEKIFNKVGVAGFYLYEKHDESRLTAQSGNFNYGVINSADTLREWMHHNLAGEVYLDLTPPGDDPLVEGTLSVMGKFPLGGQRVFEMRTFGLKCSINF